MSIYQERPNFTNFTHILLRAEMDVLRRELNLSAPFVPENGGGVFFPQETFKDAPAGSFPSEIQGQKGSEGLWQWSLGIPYAHLIRALSDMRIILGFSEMDVPKFPD